MTGSDPYLQGTAVTLEAKFTVDGNPQDPTTITFRIRQPDESLVEYVYGVAPNVFRNGLGDYSCNLSAPPLPGMYHYDAVATGDVETTIAGDFLVLPSSVVPPTLLPPGPAPGPCQQWIDGEDVARCCGEAGSNVDSSLFDSFAFEASAALFEVSGRQFAGLCERTVRPCRDNCGCWGPPSMGLGPWFWSTWPAWGVGSGWWRNEAGDKLGCQPMSTVPLAGYPIREIVEVRIDGNVLPALDTNGNPNYRLDMNRELVRMDDPGPPVTPRRWPGCQNMSLDPSKPGTFEVTYRCGIDPPQLGRDAACQIACQLYLAITGKPTQLPSGTTRVVRQGVQIERGLLANWFDPSKPTGLVAVDMFLKAYWRNRTSRPPAVFSPDLQQFPRITG